MKKIKVLSSPKIVGILFLYFTIPVTIFVLYFYFCNASELLKDLYILLILWDLVVIIVTIRFRNAFAVVSIDDVGIKRGRTAIKWDEEYNIEIVAVYFFKYNFIIPTLEIDLLCISKEQCRGFFAGSSKCIYLTMTEKNMQMLKQYSKGTCVYPKNQ